MNATYFDAKSMKSDALAPTKPIQSASLEPSWPKIDPNIGLLGFLSIWGAILEVENDIKIDPEIKTFSGIPRNFVFTIGDPKSVKTRFQN